MSFRFLVSIVVLIAGAVYGADLHYSGGTSYDPLISTLWHGYLFWAVYWGLPTVLGWWWRLSVRPGFWPVFWKWLFGLIFLPIVIPLFSVYGGAIYLCLKDLWTSRR